MSSSSDSGSSLPLLEVLSLKGTAKILTALKKKERMSYSELARIVGFSTTASRALKAMERHKLVNKQVLNEPYRPVVYSLTERGAKLSELVEEIASI